MSSPQYSAPAMGGLEVQKLTWHFVLHRTYTLYAKNFWNYFLIALLPMAMAYLFSYVAREIYRQIWTTHQLTDFAKAYLVVSLYGWIRGAAYWILSALFCAAVAATFHRDQTSELAVSDAYTLPRHRVGAIAVVALLAWTVFFIGRSSLKPALVYLMRRVHVNPWIEIGVIDVFLLALAGLVARLGLAIPALMQDPRVSIRKALRTSVQRTEGWENIFYILPGQSRRERIHCVLAGSARHALGLAACIRKRDSLCGDRMGIVYLPGCRAGVAPVHLFFRALRRAQK
jgi:hypothetical protein